MPLMAQHPQQHSLHQPAQRVRQKQRHWQRHLRSSRPPCLRTGILMRSSGAMQQPRR